MKRFEHREVFEAIKYAEDGGQALHVWEPNGYTEPNMPICFRRTNRKTWAHLIDYNKERLIKSAKSFGVRIIKVSKEGVRGQHIDLCGKPLLKAMELCKTLTESEKENGQRSD